MRSWAPLLVLLAFAGCSHGGGPGPTPVPSGTPYLVDGAEPGMEAPFDVLQAYIQQLNGSFVVAIEFRNFTDSHGGDPRLPQVEARVRLESSAGTRWYYARNEPDFSRPPPHLRWVMGRYEGENHFPVGGICTENTVRGGEPWLIRLELLHNQTGLEGQPGTVTRLEIYTSDFENHTMDQAAAEGRFPITGGPNPHDTCPLVAERPTS